MIGAVVLLWGNDVSLSRLFWSMTLVLLLLAVVQVLVGAGGLAATASPTVADRHGSDTADAQATIPRT